MKKISSLLKRVSLFEKMAVYGNRDNFLKSIAQEVPRLEKLKEAFSKASSLVDDAFELMIQGVAKLGSTPNVATYLEARRWMNRGKDIPDMKSKISVLYKASKDLYDFAMSQKNYDAATNFTYMSYRLKDAQYNIRVHEENIIPLQEVPSTTPAPTPTPTDYTPATVFVADKPGYPPINLADQANVKWYTLTRAVSGSAGFIGEDSVLGPMTRKSIEAAKKHLNMSGATDSELFKKLREIRSEDKKSSNVEENGENPMEKIRQIENEKTYSFNPETI